MHIPNTIISETYIEDVVQLICSEKLELNMDSFGFTIYASRARDAYLAAISMSSHTYINISKVLISLQAQATQPPYPEVIQGSSKIVTPLIS